MVAGDGSVATGETVSHSYDDPGTYLATLTVTDDDGLTDTATATVPVRANGSGTLPPEAAFVVWSGSPVAGEPATFAAVDSTDPDGTVVAYDWTFGDGANASGFSVEHTYDSVGTSPVTLTVTDDDGATDSVTSRVVVDGGPGPDGADFVVDDGGAGVDYRNITSAVDAAVDGDRIVVRPGTYREQVTLSENLTLEAPDGAALNGSGIDDAATGSPVAFTVEGAAPTVEGFTVTGYDQGVSATYTDGAWVASDLRVLTPRYGVTATRSTGDWRLANVSVVNPRGAGVLAPDSDGDWTVRNLTVRNASGAGLNADDSTGEWTVGASTVVGGPLRARDATGDWVVRNTTVRDSPDDGLRVDLSSGDWTVAGSRIANNSAGGRRGTDRR